MDRVPGRPAKKSLSQNFLIDPNLQRKIVDALEPGPDDRVIEIGPGAGDGLVHAPTGGHDTPQ